MSLTHSAATSSTRVSSNFPTLSSFLLRISTTHSAIFRRSSTSLCPPISIKKASSFITNFAASPPAVVTQPPSPPFTASGEFEYGRLLPCPTQSGQPRVEHMVVKQGGPVLEYVTEMLGLPPLYVADLIHFGSVHYALVCPKPPPTATPEEFKVFEEATNPEILKSRESIKGKTVREAQKTFRITQVDEFVETGTYLRVHVHPKRSPRCYEIDWKSRVIEETENYVVLDKPAGTSVCRVSRINPTCQ